MRWSLYAKVHGVTLGDIQIHTFLILWL